jgi:hypothetical protein
MQSYHQTVANEIPLKSLASVTSRHIPYLFNFISLDFAEPSLGLPTGSSTQKSNTNYYFPVITIHPTYSGSRAFTGANSLYVNNTTLYVGTNIVAGPGNITNNTSSSIVGGSSNATVACNSFIGGGSGNSAIGAYSNVVGGISNSAKGLYSSILGGNLNNADNNASVIAGGTGNIACGYASATLGGKYNCVTGDYSSAIGACNTVSGDYSTVTGLGNNTKGDYTAIIGGSNNIICQSKAGDYGGSVIIGGSTSCIINNSFNTIAGGEGHCLHNTSHAFVGGGIGNNIEGYFCQNTPYLDSATIVGGYVNYIGCHGCNAFIGGGSFNSACCGASSVVGGCYNKAVGCQSTVSGGYSNSACGESSFVGAGFNNCANGRFSFVGAGFGNRADGNYSVVVGGGSDFCESNTASSDYSFIGAGSCNCIELCAFGSVIVGGQSNCIAGACLHQSAFNSVIVGGVNNSISETGCGSFIGGGSSNNVSGRYSVIVGGGLDPNTVSGNYSFIGSGGNHCLCGDSSFIGAGGENKIGRFYNSAILSGATNTLSGDESAIISGLCNIICNNTEASIIGAGQCNHLNGYSSFLGAGTENKICAADASSIVSGCSNTIKHCQNGCSVTGSFIGGGSTNYIKNDYSAIVGGYLNTNSGKYSIVGAGSGNKISSNLSFIAGGQCNDTKTFDNTFILGSKLSASKIDFTYVNNISSQGDVRANYISSNSSNITSLTSTNIVTSNIKALGILTVSGNAIFGNDVSINNNLTVYGLICAVSGIKFNTTYVSATTALSVINTGIGPAFYVSQTGTYDIAQFVSTQGYEVLHVGNSPVLPSNGTNGYVGINTKTPNAELTVNGSISSNNSIYIKNSVYADKIYTQTLSAASTIITNDLSSNNSVYSIIYKTPRGNSDQWQSVYDNQTNILTLTGNWQSTYQTVCALSARWESVYQTVCALSAGWQTFYQNSSSFATTSFVQNNFLPLSGGTMIGDISSVNVIKARGFWANNTYNSLSGSGVIIDYLQGSPGVGRISVNNDTGSDSLAFYSKGVINNTPTLYLSSNNFVGINTPIPNQHLTVNGNISATGIIFGAGTLYKAVTSIGNGTLRTFNFNHNLNTRDIVTQVYDNITYAVVYPTIVNTGLNSVSITFNTAPALTAYRVVVQG